MHLFNLLYYKTITIIFFDLLLLLLFYLFAVL